MEPNTSNTDDEILVNPNARHAIPTNSVTTNNLAVDKESTENSTKEDSIKGDDDEIEQNSDTPLLMPPIEQNVDTPRPISHRIFGLSLILACSVLASTQGAIIKFIDVVPAGEVVVILAIHGVCFYSIAVTHQNISLINFPNRKYIFMRTILGAMGFVAKVWSIEHMPYGDATALLFTIPFFAGIFARFFLKEKYSLADIFATVVGLAGIFMVAQPSFLFPKDDDVDYPGWYALVPLGTAVMIGWSYVCVRKAGKGVSPIVVSFYLVAFQVVAGTIYQLSSKVSFVNPSCYKDRALLLVCAFLAVSMYMCLNKGLALEKSATATLVRNVDTALAYFIQIVVFKDPADAWSLIGVGLIAAGTVSITLAKAFDITCGVQI